MKHNTVPRRITSSDANPVLTLNNGVGTNNIQEWQDNGSAVLTIGDGGNIGQFVAPTTTSGFYTQKSINSASGSYIGVNSQVYRSTTDQTDGGLNYGFYFRAQAGVGSNGYVAGMKGDAYAAAGAGKTINAFYGGWYYVNKAGACSVSYMYGQKIDMGIDNVAGNVGSMYGLAITNSIGATASGTVSDLRGISIGAISTGGMTVTSKWGLYQAGASDQNYFAGRVGIGYTVPEDLLHIVGGNTNTSTAFASTLGIRLRNNSNTVGNYTSITNHNYNSEVNTGIFLKNIDQAYAGAIHFTTRSIVNEYGIRMIIGENGYVGIGTSGTPTTAKLVVNNGGTAIDIQEWQDNGTKKFAIVDGGSPVTENNIGYRSKQVDGTLVTSFIVDTNNDGITYIPLAGRSYIIKEPGGAQRFAINSYGQSTIGGATAPAILTGLNAEAQPIITANSQTYYNLYLNPKVNVQSYTGITGYGQIIKAPTKTGAGTIDTYDQFYIETPTAATTNYSLRTAGGLIVLNESGGDYDTRIEGDTDANLLFVDAGADKVGVGTGTPTIKFSTSETSGLTAEGGYAIKLTAAEALSKGEVVYINQAGADNKVTKNPIDGDMPVGIVYADAAQDAAVWIVVSGLAEVLPNAADTASRGYVIYSSSTTAGRVSQASTLPAVALHNREIGHWIANGSGAGVLTKAIIHWN